MPEVRHYKVTQVREINVTTNDERGAFEHADAAFQGFARGPEEHWGRVTSEAKTTEVKIERTL